MGRFTMVFGYEAFLKGDELSEDGIGYTCSTRGRKYRNLHELMIHLYQIIDYQYNCVTVCDAV
jgi:hypothetical protein